MKRRSLFLKAFSRLARDYSLPFMMERPRTVHLVPTTACNLKCKACPKTYHNPNSEHMYPAVYEKIRQEILPFSQHVHLQGLGEPTLSPLFPQMLRDASKYRIPISFVTNLSNLSDEIIALLGSVQATVTVSVDGATRETHEHSREGSNFAEIMANLDRLSRQKNMGQGLTINFSSVVTEYNITEIPNIIRLAAKNRASSIVLITPGMGDRKDEFAQASIAKHEDLYRKQLAAIQEAERQTGVIVQYPLYVRMPEEDRVGVPPPAQGQDEEKTPDISPEMLHALRGNLHRDKRLGPTVLPSPDLHGQHYAREPDFIVE